MFINKKKIVALFGIFYLFILAAPAYNSMVEIVALVFPVPPQTKKMLFYIQRSTNTNTIIYDANITSEGKINSEDALDIYWIRYSDQGQKKKLSYMENVLAYGADAVMDKTKPNTFTVHFAASKKKTVTCFLDPNGQAIAQMAINGKVSRLQKIFVQAEETSWLPKVKYVEIVGSDIQTGVQVIEKIFP